MNTRSLPTEQTASAIFFSGATYFVHFLALGFGSFPLQTHLRQVLTPATASFVASIIPIAACCTYFLFRFAESRGWTRSPRWILFCAAVGVSLLQLLLGWRLQHASSGSFVFGPAVDVAMCLLLLGCVQSSVMTLLNHIGVATMGDHAYSVRAAGSAGYMFALILMGSLSSSAEQVENYHLFIGATISVIHAVVAFGAWFLLPEDFERHVAKPHVAHAHSAMGKTNTGAAGWGKRLEWVGLLLLVWLVAICEMSYSLYSHEFLTTTYGNQGYYVFATAVGLEIALLVSMPFFPKLKSKLLFVGPLGWIMLFTGCLIATQGASGFGLFGLALALNCPFQISTNEHAHRMNSSVLGVASMTLAQSLGYMTSTMIASLVSQIQSGPAMLWLTVLPCAFLALGFALRRLARERREKEQEVVSKLEQLAEPGLKTLIELDQIHDLIQYQVLVPAERRMPSSVGMVSNASPEETTDTSLGEGRMEPSATFGREHGRCIQQ